MKNEDRPKPQAASARRVLPPPPQASDLQQDDEDAFILSEFEGLTEATTLSRLSGDLELINELRLSGFSKSDAGYQHFAQALAEYGFSVLMAWQLRGIIFIRCNAHPSIRRHLVGMPSSFSFSSDLAFELATDAVASLKTFFVGQALYQFVAAPLKTRCSLSLLPGGHGRTLGPR